LLSIPHIADFPMALATALDDPCLRLLAYVLHRLGHACGRVESSKRNDSQVADSVADSVAARKVLAAIAAGETLGAALRARILSLMDPVRWLSEPSQVPDPFQWQASPLNRSRVGRLVRAIATDVNQGGVTARDFLGSEATLSERYAVARSTLRQALCVLEDARIVAARRGRGNGWFVCAANPELPLRQIRNYLAGHAIAPAHVSYIARLWRRNSIEKVRNPLLDLLLRGMTLYADRSATAVTSEWLSVERAPPADNAAQAEPFR
jgi:hypothetical protein